MRRSRPMFTAAVVVMLLIMSAAAVSGVRTSWVTALGARVVVPTMSVARSVRSFVATFMSRRDLVREDAQLQAQLQDSEHQTAQIALLSQELETARAAAELHQRITGSYTEAGIVAWPREGGVREVIIDRGSRDGIEVGDDVVTPHGALIGTVRSTGSDSATVTAVGDPAFEAAAQVASGSITGLVRSDPQAGLILDLVRKDEPIHEGQLVMTDGGDGLVGGLLIGTVRSVEQPAASLFSLVHLTPAMDPDIIGRVIVIHP